MDKLKTIKVKVSLKDNAIDQQQNTLDLLDEIKEFLIVNDISNFIVSKITTHQQKLLRTTKSKTIPLPLNEYPKSDRKELILDALTNYRSTKAKLSLVRDITLISGAGLKDSKDFTDNLIYLNEEEIDSAVEAFVYLHS